jgi:putative membrane protein
MMMGGGWLIGFLVLLLFVLLIGAAVVAVVWFARQGSLGGRAAPMAPRGREDEALEILRRRYARGEITREEFERMREEVRS